MSDLKTLNLNLETNLHRQQNKKNPANRKEGNKQTTQRKYRSGKRKERKYKNTGSKRNKQKNMLWMWVRQSWNQRLWLKGKYLYYWQSKQTNKERRVKI